MTIAATIGLAAVSKGLYLKQAEVHGMSQRGGAVQSHLRLSSSPIHSDLIPRGKADMIIAVEPMESIRYIPMLSPDGWLITNNTPYANIPGYPDMNALLPEIRSHHNHIIIDAEQTARDIGSKRSANMVTLGAALPFLEIEMKHLEDALRQLFGHKGEEMVQTNLKALEGGKKATREYQEG